jgi:isochorismate synthase
MTEVWYQLPHQTAVFYHKGELQPWVGQPGFVIRPWEGRPAVIPGSPVQVDGSDSILVAFTQGMAPQPVQEADFVATGRRLLVQLEPPLQKIVLARTALLEGPWDAAASFHQLRQARPNALVYLLNHPQWGLWLGATPETLLEQNHQQFKVMSLAGTRPTGSAGAWGEKEVLEQALVTQFIGNVLGKHCGKLEAKGPYTLAAGAVEHLCTELVGVSESTSAIHLAEELHPTPAVCGWPTSTAKDWIQHQEGIDRKLYTGYLGPVTETKAHLMVNLRCVNLFDTHAVAYAGGGWVQGSDPHLEWEETNRKVASIAMHLVKAQ